MSNSTIFLLQVVHLGWIMDDDLTLEGDLGISHLHLDLEAIKFLCKLKTTIEVSKLKELEILGFDSDPDGLLVGTPCGCSFLFFC